MLTERTAYTKSLCMSELRVMRTRLTQTHYFDAREGSAYTSFVFAQSGGVTLNTMGRRLTAEAGSLLYIPEGQRFHAVWQGDPEIEFFSLHIIHKKIDLANTDRYEVQRIDALSTPQTGERFAQIYALFATESRIDRVRAIGLYYDFYADVLPYLHPAAPAAYNPALLAALDYIEQHLAEDFDVHTLAAAVCVSESRLYHLFQAQLGVTPVKFRNERRIIRAAGVLRTTDRSIEEIADSCGFHSTIYFRETFKQFTGMTPSEYRTLAK